MQTPINDSGIFTEVSRSTQASPSPCWSPSQGIPCKGQASGRVTLWIASGLPHAQVSLRRAFRQPSPGCSPPSSLSSFWPKRHGPCSLSHPILHSKTKYSYMCAQDVQTHTYIINKDNIKRQYLLHNALAKGI